MADGTLRAASDRVPVTQRPPWNLLSPTCRRRPVGDDLEDEPVGTFDVGNASVTLFERAVTDAERERWREEDEERDRRRIPLGFRPPA
jgi:hypothetical protein